VRKRTAAHAARRSLLTLAERRSWRRPGLSVRYVRKMWRVTSTSSTASPRNCEQASAQAKENCSPHCKLLVSGLYSNFHSYCYFGKRVALDKMAPNNVRLTCLHGRAATTWSASRAHPTSRRW